MSPVGRLLPRAVQHGDVRYLGNDSHYMGKLTSRSVEVMPEIGHYVQFPIMCTARFLCGETLAISIASDMVSSRRAAHNFYDWRVSNCTYDGRLR